MYLSRSSSNTAGDILKLAMNFAGSSTSSWWYRQISCGRSATHGRTQRCFGFWGFSLFLMASSLLRALIVELTRSNNLLLLKSMTAKKLLTAKNCNEVLMKILSTLELIVKYNFWFCFCLFQDFLCFQGNVSDFVFREGCQCSQKSDGQPGKIGRAAKIRPI